MFLVALSFAYFAKALSGSYMKSTITQLERRFDIPSYLIGVIDGSFEIGNLLVIAFVSYFGAKLHRPKMIGAGCLIMSIGTFLIAMPHFFIGRYKFETTIRSSANSTSNLSPCPASSDQTVPGAMDKPSILTSTGCEKEVGFSMWIYVFLGNVLRGIGETPVQPLGISYIDDFAREENAAFYIGCVQTIAIIGPVFGFLLGSLCARIFVDIGFVDMDTRRNSKTFPEQSRFIKQSPTEKKYDYEEPANFTEIAKDFVPSLKSLLVNPVYVLYLCVTIIQFNSLIGMVTYKPKYIEQHYGQSASKANFLIGVINIPAVALGIFSGGLLMKKFKLSVMGAAKFVLGTSLLGYVLSLFFFAMGCENATVAGLTVSYQGCIKPELKSLALGFHTLATRTLGNLLVIAVVSYFGAKLHRPKLIGAGCLLMALGSFVTVIPHFIMGKYEHETSIAHSVNLTTYILPCQSNQAVTSDETANSEEISVAECQKEASSSMWIYVFLGNMLRGIGETPVMPLGVSYVDDFAREENTAFYLACIQTVGILGPVFGYMMGSLCAKLYVDIGFVNLSGIPSPIYFGALIDMTCLKWGSNKCGGRGACRMYDSNAFK
ncbi:UNVERIFIED_CONTAM: hypothetical protein FKN15_070972 [Acipenser sinensis]